jgi:hypothetical protein
MGFRDRLRDRAKRAANRFSGEFSDPAPTDFEPYAVPGEPDENAEVVMAKLKRPTRARTKPKTTDPKKS